jgi:Fe(II)/alpha-ketoglutarate-dependent arginine beta-hydroxylase
MSLAATPASARQTAPATIPDPVAEPFRIILTSHEVADIRALLSDLTRRYSTPENAKFLEEADLVAHELPLRIRRTLREFRLNEPASAMCLVSGWPIDEEKLGPTPAHWKHKATPTNRALDEEMLLVLLGSLLGDLIAWSTQQDGRIVHDVMPIKGHEQEQLGSGSEQLLWWHVEDAFHDYRGDYLGLMCLRNPDRVPTTFASMARARVTPEQFRLLSDLRFTIRPDESHLPKNRGTGGLSPLVERAYTKIERMMQSPDKVAVLFGDPQAPYVRLDPYFMAPVENAPEAQQALDAVIAKIGDVLEDCVLEQGQICFIDNYQGVHGRRPFHARFDGTDRWLKRINLTRDLRKSRDARESAASRLLY